MKREIVTTYFFKNERVQVNRAVHVENAILLAVSHMQNNSYGANVAEVICCDRLVAQIHRPISSANSKILITYVDGELPRLHTPFGAFL